MDVIASWSLSTSWQVETPGKADVFNMEMELPYVYAIIAKEAGSGVKRFRPKGARCFVISTVMICYTT
jgi:hypothetical protein